MSRENLIGIHPTSPAVVALLAIDLGLWLNMVNVKPPYLLNMEIESMKKFILEYKRYSQSAPDNFCALCSNSCSRIILGSSGQGVAGQWVYLTAEAFSEEEESGLTMTGGRNDAHGMSQPRATRAQLDTMRAVKKERRIDKMASFRDTAVRPLLEITTMVNYLGVERRADDKDPGQAHRDGRGGHRRCIKHFLMTRF